MGFQDRDYNREPYNDNGYRPRRGGGMSVTMRLVILNFILWLANGLLFSESSQLTGLLAMNVNTLWHPAYWWKFVTYGFAHSPSSLWHIVGNMITLIMFGYGMMLGIGPGGFGLVRGENVENRLGKLEFLVFYLLTIIVGGVVFCVVNLDAPRSTALGASGGCVGVVILYALLYPTKTLLLYGILPVPMWALGIFFVLLDVQGASGGGGGVAYSIHLAGAAFALFYYFVFLSRGNRIVDIFSVPKWLLQKKPKLSVYHGDEFQKKSAKDEEFERRLDARRNFGPLRRSRSGGPDAGRAGFFERSESKISKSIRAGGVNSRSRKPNARRSED